MLFNNFTIKDFEYFKGYKLSPYHQYLLYSMYGLDIMADNVYKLVLDTERRFDFDIKDFNILMKELYYGHKIFNIL